MERSKSQNYRLNRSRNKRSCANKNFKNLIPLNIKTTFNNEIKNNYKSLYNHKYFLSDNISSLNHSKNNSLTHKIKSFQSNQKTKKIFKNSQYFLKSNKSTEKDSKIKPLYSKYNLFNDYGVKNELKQKESNLVKIKGEIINDKDKVSYINLMQKIRQKYGLKGNFYVYRKHKKSPSSENNFEWVNCFLTYEQLKEIKNKQNEEEKKYEIYFLDHKGIKRKIKAFKYNRYENNFTKAFSIINYGTPNKFINKKKMY